MATDNPYGTLYPKLTLGSPAQPSSGTVGDFLRNILPQGTPELTPELLRNSQASTTQVPVAPVVPVTTNTPQIPDNIRDRARIYNAAQVAGGLVPRELLPENRINPGVPLPPQRPTLEQAVQRTPRTQRAEHTYIPSRGLDDDKYPNEIIPAPKGYTPPTMEDIKYAQELSDAYWAPYRRKQEIENRNLALKELEIRGKIAPKPPTLRDQLYGKAYEAVQEQYKVALEEARLARDPGWFAGEDAHTKARAAAELAARKKYLSNLITLGQPNFNEAQVLAPNADTK